ncbi:MAG: hypothetical protein ACRENB_17035 [Gemmatimonadales bacterium]
MSRHSVVLSVALLLAPLAAPSTPSAPGNPADALVASLLRWNASAAAEATAADSPYCWNCWSRIVLGYANHQFDWSAVFEGYECDGDGCHFFETPGICEWYHTTCRVIGSEWLGEPGALDRVERVVAEGDAAGLRALMDGTRALTLNAGRQALQVLNCQGEVIAHFPLAGRLMAQLSE